MTTQAVRLLPYVLLLLALSLSSTALAQHCHVKTDDSTGHSYITCDVVEVTIEQGPQGQNVFAATVIFGDAKEGPFFVISTVSDSFVLQGNDTAYALVDGKDYEYTLNSVRHATRDDGAVIEQVAVHLDNVHLPTLMDADSFRLQVGDTVLDASSALPAVGNLIAERMKLMKPSN